MMVLESREGAFYGCVETGKVLPEGGNGFAVLGRSFQATSIGLPIPRGLTKIRANVFV